MGAYISAEAVNPIPGTTQAITVPATCTAVVVGWCGYSSGATNIDALNIDGDAFTINQALTGNATDNFCGIATLANPSTGAQTLTWSWSSAGGAEGALFVAYVNAVDTAALVGDSDLLRWTDNTSYNFDLTTDSDDLVIGGVWSYPATTPDGTDTDQTVEVNDAQPGFNYYYDLVTHDSPGSSTTNFTGSGNYGALIAVALNNESTGGTINEVTLPDGCLVADGSPIN